MLKGYLEKGNPVHGRLNGSLPRDGELNPNLIAIALDMQDTKEEKIPELVKNRPPSMCQGCGHIDAYIALNEALKSFNIKGNVFSDIGCYTLGALPPYNAINTCVDMGASITMAIGAADAGLFPSVAVIGDSTFTHSGITGLLDAVNNNSPVTVIISDNSTTAMTGGQDSAGTGKIEKICIGIGVNPEHIRIINPLRKNHEENVKIMKEEIAYNGISVIIPQRECIQTLAKKNRQKQNKENIRTV